MPFEALDTVTGRYREGRVSISYKRKKSARWQEPRPSLYVGIPREIAKGFTPKKDAAYEFQRGTGQDEGKARIAPAKNGGGKTLACVKGGYVIRFGFVPYLGTSAAETDYVAARIVDGHSIEIDLPPWFKPDEEVESA
jgi:hypothetical protein